MRSSAPAALARVALVAAVALVARGLPGAPATATGSAGDVVVAGDLARTGAATLAELKALGASHLTWTSHGKTHEVVGARLDRLLSARGFEMGAMGKAVPKAEKRSGWKKMILVTAADGYQALFSAAEIFEHMGATAAVLAWEIDGEPIGKDRGPLRLVVTTDQEPSRSVYSVRRIEVVGLPALSAGR